MTTVYSLYTASIWWIWKRVFQDGHQQTTNINKYISLNLSFKQFQDQKYVAFIDQLEELLMLHNKLMCIFVRCLSWKTLFKIHHNDEVYKLYTAVNYWEKYPGNLSWNWCRFTPILPSKFTILPHHLLCTLVLFVVKVQTQFVKPT